MHRPRHRWLGWLHAGAAVGALIGATPILWRIAYPAMFSRFQPYDDEGYLLVSVRSYMAGNALYDDVFTQYGPFHYQLLSGIFRAAGGAPTHDDGRLLTLAIWLIAGALAGIAAYVFTRSVLLAVGSQMLAFMALFTVTNEPLHPGAMLCLLLLALAGSLAMISWLPQAGWFVVGSLTALMALTKVNIGGLALIAVAVAAIVSSDAPRWARGVAALALPLVPFALMARDLGDAGILGYALVVGSAGATVVAFGALDPRPTRWRETLKWLGTGVGATTVVVLGAAVIQGASISGLIEGVLLRPLGQSEAFTLPMLLAPGAVTWAVVTAVVGGGLAVLLAQRRIRLHPVAGAAIRIIGGLLMLLAIGGLFRSGLPSFASGIPLAWVALLPDEERGRRRGAILSLACLCVLQALHAYPVAGSQTAWSGLLLAPLGAVAIGDGVRLLARGRLPSRRALVVAATMLPVVLALAWVAAGPLRSLHQNVFGGYLSFSSPALSGAERLRMNRPSSRAFTKVTARLRQECGTFYSWPGMNSFYLFAQQEPPTTLNATHWMTLFDDDLQRRVVEDIRGTEDLCVLRNQGITAFWLQGRPEPQGPLTTYLAENFVPRVTVQGYEILVEPS